MERVYGIDPINFRIQVAWPYFKGKLEALHERITEQLQYLTPRSVRYLILDRSATNQFIYFPCMRGLAGDRWASS